MFEKYKKNGTASRARIAEDIRNRALSHEDVLKLLDDEDVKNAFLGTSYSDKKDKTKWNQEYLDILALTATNVAFNKEYILHLEEVADYVATQKKLKKSLIIGGVIVIFTIVLSLSIAQCR